MHTEEMIVETNVVEEEEKEGKKKYLWLLLLLLLLSFVVAWMFMFPKSQTGDEMGIKLSTVLDTVKVSSFDRENTRASSLLNNVVLTVADVEIFIDSSKGTIDNGSVVYVSEDLTVTISNAVNGGIATVTATYSGESATVDFTVIVITPEPGQKGNVIEAPIKVSETRDTKIIATETNAEVDADKETVSTEQPVVTNPEDLATPENVPDATVIPPLNYNKVYVSNEDGTKLSLFAEGDGTTLVILFKDGQYINYASKNRIEFTILEVATGVSFDMKEYNADGNVIEVCNAIYSK